MRHGRFMIALGYALVIHVCMVWFLSGRVTTKPPQREKIMVPVELIQIPEEKIPPKKPEKPDLLAQVDRVTEAKPALAKTEALPRPESEPLPGHSVTSGPEKQNKITAEPPVRAKAPIKADKNKENKKKTTPSVQKDEIISKPLSLSPTLSDINRWDDENNIKDQSHHGREQTLDLNTSKVQYAVYFSRLKERIEQGWIYPERAKNLNLSGNLRLKFTIDRDGNLLALNILRSSGESILDESALNAVKGAAPFAPFPQDWQLEKIHVTTTFEYIRRKILWRP
ncbi:MAG: energy transducer TonB [Magnetococcales bacterium]|nr:energy transducer TonB [Magnetococcales bacterium]MBF0349093.1 energy transducer TonB [Magnetococcales bacterium]